jgi:hypothetical protein
MLVNSRASLEEVRSSNDIAGLLLLTGQPGGTTSMEDGTLEVMIHRKTGTRMWQDYQHAASHFRLMAGPISWLEAARSHQNLQVQYPIEVLYSPTPSSATPYGSFFAPFAAESLPLDTHLFTLAAEDFIAVAIPDLDYDGFMELYEAESRYFAVTPANVDASKIAVRLQNLYPDAIAEVTLPFTGCVVDTCEERGLTLLPFREHHKFAQHSTWKNQPFFDNQLYTVTAAEDLEVFNDTCERLHLSPSDIRTISYKFDCV